MDRRLSDTHPEAERVQLGGLRSVTLSRKLQMVSDLTVTTRLFALSGLRARFSTATSEELHRRLAALTLGTELATRVYGAEPDLPAK